MSKLHKLLNDSKKPKLNSQRRKKQFKFRER